MQYLHEKNIVHRDLKSHNLLLDEQHRVKVTDFGTARHLDLITGTAYTEVGTGGYMAPEVIEPPLHGYDFKVYVFSYGVLLWEMLTRKSVFGEKTLKVKQIEFWTFLFAFLLLLAQSTKNKWKQIIYINNRV